MDLPLPADLKMRNTLHGRRAKGGYVYRYSDADGLGVNAVADKLERGQPERVTWSFAWLPEREFRTYDELRAAVAGLTDEQLAAEKARYPFVREIEPVEPGRKYANRCRLCPFAPEARVDGKYSVVLANSPDPMDDDHTELCEAHRPIADNPRELAAALAAEVAARKAAAAAKGFPW